jgi:plasmid stability protein
MASITLKDIPSELHEKLKESAKQRRRSLNSEVIARLEQSIEPRRTNVEELLEKARRFRSTLTFEVTDEEINESKRQGRL